MIAGFVLGGIALTQGSWPVFWAGVGVFAVGGIVALAVGILDDVMLDPIHQERADPHVSPFRRAVADDAPDHLDPKAPGQGPSVDGYYEPGSDREAPDEEM